MNPMSGRDAGRAAAGPPGEGNQPRTLFFLVFFRASSSLSFSSIFSLNFTLPMRTQPGLPGTQSVCSFMQFSVLKSKFLQEKVMAQRI